MDVERPPRGRRLRALLVAFVILDVLACGGVGFFVVRGWWTSAGQLEVVVENKTNGDLHDVTVALVSGVFIAQRRPSTQTLKVLPAGAAMRLTFAPVQDEGGFDLTAFGATGAQFHDVVGYVDHSAYRARITFDRGPTGALTASVACQ